MTLLRPGRARNGCSRGPNGDFPVRIAGTLETNSPIAMRVAAVRGQGLVIGPAPWLFDDLKSGALVPVLRDFLPKQFSIDVLYPHREHLPAKVRKFIDIVAKNFSRFDWDSYVREVDRLGNPINQAIVSKHPIQRAEKNAWRR
jgi:DNA-binding transcriptional LysR family regulator